MTTNTYLGFPGTCEEAFNFYAKVLGGKILMTMKGEDAPKGDCGEGVDMTGKVMHTRMAIGNTVLMGSDAPEKFYQKAQGFHVNIGVESVEEAERVYAALSEGGAQTMPIAETFWAKRFGMCVDRFGTPWMVNCEKPMGG